MATVETPTTEVRAQARYVRTAPRKAQLIAEQIRGRTVPEARTILAFTTRDAARDVEKVLNSAIANAEANHGLTGDDLIVSAAYVGAGPTIKRWRARARGRVARIRKRTCHITIRLAEPEEAAAARATETEDAPSQPTKPRRGRVAETTEPVERPEEKPKTRPKRAQKPKAEAAEAEGPEGEKKPRRARPKTAAEGSDETTEKPSKRTTRTKKSEEGDTT